MSMVYCADWIICDLQYCNGVVLAYYFTQWCNALSLTRPISNIIYTPRWRIVYNNI